MFIMKMLTSMCAFVVLQITSSGKLLATVLLVTDEGLLTIVCPHVDLQSLKYIKALPTALSATAESAVIPEVEVETHTHTHKVLYTQYNQVKAQQSLV